MNITSFFKMEEPCSICYSALQDPIVTDCAHKFCRACLLQWKNSTMVRFNCPTCRNDLSTMTLEPFVENVRVTRDNPAYVDHSYMGIPWYSTGWYMTDTRLPVPNGVLPLVRRTTIERPLDTSLIENQLVKKLNLKLITYPVKNVIIKKKKPSKD